MPVYKCSNQKYRIGSGKCIYKSKASAERAYKGYKESKHMNERELIEMFEDEVDHEFTKEDLLQSLDDHNLQLSILSEHNIGVEGNEAWAVIDAPVDALGLASFLLSLPGSVEVMSSREGDIRVEINLR